MKLLDKIKALFGKSAAEDSAQDDNTRRRFLRQLVALTGGVATGLILPTRTLVTVPASLPVIIGNYYKFNLGRKALRILPGESFQAKICWPVAPDGVYKFEKTGERLYLCKVLS